MSDDVVVDESPSTDVLRVTESAEQVVEDDSINVVIVEQILTDVLELENVTDVVVVEQVGIRGPQGPPGDGPQVTFIAIAGVNLSGERIVTSQADGTIVYADNDDVADLDQPLWLTMTAALAGSQVRLLAFGPFTEPTWSWTEGVSIFLGTNGALTQATPLFPGAAFVVQVATTVTPTTLFYNPRSPIVLAA